MSHLAGEEGPGAAGGTGVAQARGGPSRADTSGSDREQSLEVWAGQLLPWRLNVPAACPRPHAHPRERGWERAPLSPLVWAHPAEDATALVEVARLGAFWDSPGHQPGVPIGLWPLQKTRLWEWGGSHGPRGSAHVPHGLLRLHPSRVPWVSVRLSFFEETDSIFYREQAVLLIFVSFFRCDFYLCSDPHLLVWVRGCSIAPVTPEGGAARPGHVLGPGALGVPSQPDKHTPPPW